MIKTSDKPFTREEIDKLKAHFSGYIKTVIDIEKKLCSAGMDRHYEGEKILIDSGSKQSNIWGGGIDTNSKAIDYNSFINIRPNDNNPSNDVLNLSIREKYEALTKLFFKVLYD